MTRPINGDLSMRVVMDTHDMAWSASPSGTVWRKRVHLVGGDESGQVTSVVRYEPGAAFPPHDHPGGEEILVLKGVFSDEHGNWPEGTYLLNPEGFRHAPFSEQGCTIFVKLRQYPGSQRRHVATQTQAMEWQPASPPGAEIKPLYVQDTFSDTTRLERWARGIELGRRTYPEGAELFVVSGKFRDEAGDYRAGSWLRMPSGQSHEPRTDEGCTLYIKEGGFTYLETTEE